MDPSKVPEQTSGPSGPKIPGSLVPVVGGAWNQALVGNVTLNPCPPGKGMARG